jgi:CBS domain-containing protein/anti-sigma regulatory factor (Ser/Thr protein kinase)
MLKSFPIGTDKATSAVMEIILRLKIKDSMTTDLKTAARNDSLRKLQGIMKKRYVTAVPIIDNSRLVGMVTVNQIMSALDAGEMDFPAEKYMEKNLVVLEDDMPLSFAINYFNKYSYHRFPVINKEQRLVGIITSRDILITLLRELNAEMEDLEGRIEKKLAAERVHSPNIVTKDFMVTKFDFENAGRASFELKKMLKDRKISQKIIRRASVASYELEINLVIHSDGGRITFTIDDKKITIETHDEGPGIPDVNVVLQEGYSTANEWIRSLGFGAGVGLANTKRVSDEFNITSEVGKGTKVVSTIYMRGDENESNGTGQGS